jgi:hypothetical protein
LDRLGLPLGLGILALAWLSSSGRPAAAPSAPLPDADSVAIVGQVSDALRDDYPLADISAAYVAALDEGRRAGRYGGLTPCGLAERLNADLNAVHPDAHLRVACGDRGRLAARPDGLTLAAGAGHGFQAVEMRPDLPVAYVRSRGPWDLTEDTFEVAAGAMAMATRAKYVIIDVRDNPGGHGEIGRFLASYFYGVGEGQPLVVGMKRDRSKDELERTYPFVPGRRAPDARLYILVNAGTASAAEGFAFGLQRAGRATIIGQKTAGAGIAGSLRPLKDGLVMFVPSKLIVAPGTTEGWEGVGVIPDVSTAPGGEQDRAIAMIRADVGIK